MSDHPVLLFDGVCNLCNASVNFVIDRDPDAQFRLAALQSEAGAELLTSHGLEAEYLDSIVLVENGRVYRDSTAALRVARRLTAAWPLLYAFIVIPRPIRDWVYGWVAKNRYRWFGKQDVCRMPTPDLQSRFL